MAQVTNYRSVLERTNGWTVTHIPAVSTAASASKAAAAAGIKNVCTAIYFSLDAVAAQTAICFTLRDGASGAGTVLRRWWVQAAVGTTYERTYSGLWIPGSAATAMTLETCDSAGAVLAPVTNNFVNVSIDGDVTT